MAQTKQVLWGAAAPMAFTLAAAAAGASGAGPSDVLIDIPAGPLSTALDLYARETRQQLLYNSSLVAGHTVPALKGNLTPDLALDRLLKGSDIEAEHTGPTVVVLRRRRAAPSAPPPADAEPTAATPRPGENGPQPMSGRAAPTPPTAGADPGAGVVGADIVVTGSHIRGVRAAGSPVVSISRPDMDREGDATVADALLRLPQNFNGMSNPVSAASGADKSGANSNYSQGVNLRGLGSNATLVLINGRRMAGTGNFGDFVDVSALPSAAVDHVEVLLDGASAIYGSDAVGGVINVITRKNYDGADSSIRFGVDDGGGGASVLATEALGFSWPGGHMLVTYEYQHIDRLSSSSRPYTDNSDLKALGGTDHDSYESSPGNILGLNSTFTAFVPTYAIPGGSGLGLTPSSFVAGSANGQNYWHNTDIAPASDRDGVYTEITQALDPKTSLDLEARYNLRHYEARASASQTILAVTANNPYFVSPNGAASEEIGYSLDQAAGPIINTGEVQDYDLSLGLKRDLGQGWRFDSYLALAGDVGRAYSNNDLNITNLSEALGDIPANPASGFSTAKDGFYNPYGSGRSNPQALINFISDGYAVDSNVSLTDLASAQVDGPLWSLPGGLVKAAFGVQFRHEHFEPSTLTMITGTTPITSGGVVYTRDVASAFAEVDLPLVGPANALAGVERLDLSLAGRVEHYDDVGTTANPKIGLDWRPVSDLSVRTTYGTSFRAPALSEIDQPTVFAPTSQTVDGKSTLILLQYGGNPDLKPETATTWTAGLDWTPRAVPGLRLSTTWFDIDFKNEISDPGVLFLSTVLSTPGLSSIVQRLNPSNPADLAAVSALLAKAAGSAATAFPASAYGAIVDARYLNTASKVVEGVDVSGSYSVHWLGEAFSLSGGATYLDRFSQVQAAGGPSQSLLNTPGQPVNFRGRAGLDWTHGAYQASLMVNYVNSYHDPVAHRPIDAWTTCDATVSWRSPAVRGPLQGVVLSASVQNLFNTDPPFYDSPQGIGFDPANANPFGRMVAVQMNKHW